MFIFERLPFSPFKTRPHENNQKRYRVSNLIVIDFTGMNDNSEVVKDYRNSGRVVDWRMYLTDLILMECSHVQYCLDIQRSRMRLSIKPVSVRFVSSKKLSACIWLISLQLSLVLMRNLVRLAEANIYCRLVESSKHHAVLKCKHFL